MRRFLGSTSNKERIFIPDSASSVGAGKTGLTSATSGLTIAVMSDVDAAPTLYTVAASNVQTIASLGTYVAPTASKARFQEIDATNKPGEYAIQLADSHYSQANATLLDVTISGASGIVVSRLRVELPAVSLTAVAVRTEMDSNSTKLTNLDATISSRSTFAGGAVASVTGAVASVTAGVTVTTNNDKTGYALTSGERTSIASAILATAYEGSETIQTFFRLARAVLFGKTTGGGTVFRDLANSKDRVIATVASNDRTAVTTDGS